MLISREELGSKVLLCNPTRLSILLRITYAPSVQTFADLLQSNFGNRRSLRLTCTILWEHLQTYCNPTFNFDEPTHLAPNMYCIFGEHLQTHCNPTRLTLQRLWSSASVAALPFIQSIRTRRPALSGSPWIHRGTLLSSTALITPLWNVR